MMTTTTGRIRLVLTLTFAALWLGGCLTADRKEYRYTLNADGSGRGSITFYDIASVEEESTDNSLRDYNDLVSTYIKGTKFEEENPALLNVKKRLFDSGGKLNAEITFDFAAAEDIGLYRFQGKGPWMYHTGTVGGGTATESFDTSNGTYGGARMPVVFWPAETKEFMIRADIDKPSRAPQSLLPLFKKIGVE